MATEIVREGEGGPSDPLWETAGSNYIEFLGVTLLVAVAVFGAARLLGVSIEDKFDCAAKQVAGMENGFVPCPEAGAAALPAAAPPGGALKTVPDGIEGPKNYLYQPAAQVADLPPPSTAGIEEIAKMPLPAAPPPAANPVKPPPLPGTAGIEEIANMPLPPAPPPAANPVKPPPLPGAPSPEVLAEIEKGAKDAVDKSQPAP